MATAKEGEVDYESDPEEAKRSLAMRRREASDDEEGEGEASEKLRVDRRAEIQSDESDGQGGAADYDDDGELDEEEEVYEEEGEEEVIDQEVEEIRGEEGNEEIIGSRVEGLVIAVKELDGDGRSMEEMEEGRAGNQLEEAEGEKKENEPFAVPTAGAFYMHDDRFRENARGRHRRTFAGNKLWESKDDRKWGHDKFEEMTFQERRYEEGRRTSKGHYRARGKNRGTDREYTRGNRSKVYNSNNNNNIDNNKNRNSSNNSNNNNQNQTPMGIRGRGPRRYQPSTKINNQEPATQEKQPVNPLERTAHASSGRVFMPTSKVESVPLPARGLVFASSLNSASPPFYPSGSSSKDSAVTQRRDAQPRSTNRNLHSHVKDESFSVTQPNALLRGKNIVDSDGLDKLYIDDSIFPAGGKPLSNLQMPTSESTTINTAQSSRSRVQGRDVAPPGQRAYQPTPPQSQVNKISPPAQPHQRNPVQNRVQPSLHASAQQLVQRSGSGSKASSPPKTALSMNSFEAGEVDFPTELSKSKTALIGKGKGSLQGTGRGSFLYGGAQAMGATGNMGVGHGDQNFPAFLPVMQFGGQHPGGMGVPAVGMAFPGYVAQPQLGLGNSEMTWLPVLAGAAGALGATYCSPYISVDGAYHARPSGPTSSPSSSSKENNANKSNNDLKPSQRPELVSDEFGQRQNKPRRYSEMNFGQ